MGEPGARTALEELESLAEQIGVRANLPVDDAVDLQRAAVLGREFEFDVLQAMSDLDEEALQSIAIVAKHRSPQIRSSLLQNGAGLLVAPVAGEIVRGFPVPVGV